MMTLGFKGLISELKHVFNFEVGNGVSHKLEAREPRYYPPMCSLTTAHRVIIQMNTSQSTEHKASAFNPFNASCSKLLLLEGFSAILV